MKKQQFIEQIRKEKGLKKSDDNMIEDYLHMIDKELETPISQKIGKKLFFEYYNGIITEDEFEKQLDEWNKEAIKNANICFRQKYGDGIF